jgi:hypothetical protein
MCDRAGLRELTDESVRKRISFGLVLQSGAMALFIRGLATFVKQCHDICVIIVTHESCASGLIHGLATKREDI